MDRTVRKLVSRLGLLSTLGFVAYLMLGDRRRGNAVVRLAQAEQAFDEHRGAIRRQKAQRPDLYVFKVYGRIRAEDMGAMARLLEAAFDRWDQIDAVINIVDWQGVDAGAVLHPRAILAETRANAHIRRYAVVGPPEWASTMIKAFDALTPVDARVFPAGAEIAARAWAGERRG